MTPFLADVDFTLYVGDALEVLRELPAGSVDCCVTSPPYWGLRDYGTEGQLGLEATPGEYVERMVEVFAEVRRVLADDGTLWLNLGDSYAAGGNGARDPERWPKQTRNADGFRSTHAKKGHDVKVKDLVGIPWRVAFALQADGWWLRSDIVWSKPNPMPESVTDRPTKSHEYVFLLTKNARYYFDQEAVREPTRSLDPENVSYRPNSARIADEGRKEYHAKHEMSARSYNPAGRNVRSVWEIATQPYPEAHFATFPEELPRRCIAAGCAEWVCATCGKARERLVERTAMVIDRLRVSPYDHHSTRASGRMLEPATSDTIGWSDCGHDDYRPGVVLDPFMGSATTALVARKLGRHAVGIELNPEYAKLAARRLQQLSLLAEAAS